jgi:hypothetical protein
MQWRASLARSWAKSAKKMLRLGLTLDFVSCEFTDIIFFNRIESALEITNITRWQQGFKRELEEFLTEIDRNSDATLEVPDTQQTEGKHFRGD